MHPELLISQPRSEQQIASADLQQYWKIFVSGTMYIAFAGVESMAAAPQAAMAAAMRSIFRIGPLQVGENGVKRSGLLLTTARNGAR